MTASSCSLSSASVPASSWGRGTARGGRGTKCENSGTRQPPATSTTWPGARGSEGLGRVADIDIVYIRSLPENQHLG